MENLKNAMATLLLYIDPGTGYLILQAIIAVFVSIGIFFKKIKSFISNLFSKKNE